MEALLGGFAVTLSLDNLFYCFVGVLLGTVVGILPGLGPLTTIAILLPITFKMDVTSAIIMLSGIYYGVAYGGTVTSVLMRIPGEASIMNGMVTEQAECCLKVAVDVDLVGPDGLNVAA